MPLVFDGVGLDRLLPFRVVCDEALCVVEVGRSVARILGGAVVGRPFFEVVTAVRPSAGGLAAVPGARTDVPWLVRAPSGLMLRGQWVRAEQRGERRWVFAAGPHLSSPDELTAYGLTLRDLAAHDPLVEQLFQMQAQRAQLEDLEELSRRLGAAREAAEASDRAKTRFLANVSHELRTPMHIVLGFSELLSDESIAPEARRAHLAAIRSNGEALARLVDDLLDMSRIEEGQLALVNRPLRVEQLLGEVVLGLQPKARTKGLYLRLEPVGWDRPLLADGVRLRQVLQNLVDNGIKYTERGGVVVRAEPLAAPTGSVGVRVLVEDTGIGVGEGAHLLFEPFMRLERGRSVGGTGLGLALARRLARAMGGDLRHEALPQGSRFVLDVRGPEASEAAVASGRSGPRILLVGENPAILRLTRLLLERADHRVDQVGDAASAEAAVSAAVGSDAYAAVVAEPRLFDASGAELVRRMAALTTPVIFLPAGEADRVALAAAGAFGVLDAPVRGPRLVELVRAARP